MPTGRPDLVLRAAEGGHLDVYRSADHTTVTLAGPAGTVRIPTGAELHALVADLMENDPPPAYEKALSTAAEEGEQTGREEAEYRYQNYASDAYNAAGNDPALLRAYLTEIITGDLTPHPAPEPTPTPATTAVRATRATARDAHRQGHGVLVSASTHTATLRTTPTSQVHYRRTPATAARDWEILLTAVDAYAANGHRQTFYVLPAPAHSS